MSEDTKTIKLSIRQIATIMTIISLIVSAVYGTVKAAVYIDSRYVKVEDLKSYEIQRLQDLIFELNLKVENGIATPVEKALLERYRNRLELLKQEKKDKH